jgi:hypothetical protein
MGSSVTFVIGTLLWVVERAKPVHNKHGHPHDITDEVE